MGAIDTRMWNIPITAASFHHSSVEAERKFYRTISDDEGSEVCSSDDIVTIASEADESSSGGSASTEVDEEESGDGDIVSLESSAASGVDSEANSNGSGESEAAPPAVAPSPDGDSVGSAAVDLITGGLDDAISSVNSIRNEIASSVKSIARPTAFLIGDLEDLCDRLDDIIDLLDDAEDLSATVRQSSKKIRSILDDTAALRKLLSDYEPTLQETLKTVSGLGVSAAVTARDTVTLIDSTEDLMKRSGTQLDNGTKQTLDSLAAVLRRTANVMATSDGIQSSKNAMTNVIEDLWNDHTGDVDNLLMMDATAPAESLTDPRNGTPQSVQIMIRTQEIKTEEPEETEAMTKTADNSTFWGRVAQMFRDFWAAITGVFR